MRTLDSDYGGFKQLRQPSLTIRKDNRPKFSNSMSKEAPKGNPRQSNFFAEISEQARGWKQLDDFVRFLPYSDLAKHRAPFILPKGVCNSPGPTESSQTKKIYVSASHRPGPHFCSEYIFLLACSILCSNYINWQRQ